MGAQLYRQLLKQEVAAGRLDQAEAPAQVRCTPSGRAGVPPPPALAAPLGAEASHHRVSAKTCHALGSWATCASLGPQPTHRHAAGGHAVDLRPDLLASVAARRRGLHVSQVLGELCDRVRFSPEAALELHKGIYRSKLNALVRRARPAYCRPARPPQNATHAPNDLLASSCLPPSCSAAASQHCVGCLCTASQPPRFDRRGIVILTPAAVAFVVLRVLLRWRRTARSARPRRRTWRASAASSACPPTWPRRCSARPRARCWERPSGARTPPNPHPPPTPRCRWLCPARERSAAPAAPCACIALAALAAFAPAVMLPSPSVIKMSVLSVCVAAAAGGAQRPVRQGRAPRNRGRAGAPGQGGQGPAHRARRGAASVHRRERDHACLLALARARPRRERGGGGGGGGGGGRGVALLGWKRSR